MFLQYLKIFGTQLVASSLRICSTLLIGSLILLGKLFDLPYR